MSTKSFLFANRWSIETSDGPSSLKVYVVFSKHQQVRYTKPKYLYLNVNTDPGYTRLTLRHVSLENLSLNLVWSLAAAVKGTSQANDVLKGLQSTEHINFKRKCLVLSEIPINIFRATFIPESQCFVNTTEHSTASCSCMEV